MAAMDVSSVLVSPSAFSKPRRASSALVSLRVARGWHRTKQARCQALLSLLAAGGLAAHFLRRSRATRDRSHVVGLAVNIAEDVFADDEFSTRSSPEEAEESLVVELEDEMQAAIIREDFEAAARIRDEIQTNSLGKEVAVLSANRDFLEALSSRDVKRMASLWSKGEHTCCMHAKKRPVHGHSNILESWKTLFRRGRRNVDVSKTTVHLRDTVGRVVSIDEEAHLVMTNLFELTSQGWKLWHHQAGPLDPPEEKPKLHWLARFLPGKLRDMLEEARDRRRTRKFRKELEEKQLMLTRQLFKV